jgi:hypothetical protein
MAAPRGSRQEKLNKAMPIAAKVMLGDVLADLIAQYNALQADVTALSTALNTSIIIPATLAIKAGSSAIVKTSTLLVAKVDGTAVSKAANTDMSAIAGTIADGSAAAWDFYIDDAGTITTSAKTADAASAADALALLPAVPAGQVRIGSVAVATAGATFVGGTTALDAGTATATYYNASTAAAFTDGVLAETVTGLETRT